MLTSNEVQEILRAKGWEQQYPMFTTLNRIINGKVSEGGLRGAPRERRGRDSTSQKQGLLHAGPNCPATGAALPHIRSWCFLRLQEHCLSRSSLFAAAPHLDLPVPGRGCRRH